MANAQNRIQDTCLNESEGLFAGLIEGIAPRVLNKHKVGIPEGAVYIGRPSRWGNPFEIGRDGTRDEVIALYEQYIMATDELRRKVIHQLRGKDLVCFCAPKACHGDVLLRIANG